jgi:hypothetical protein
LFYHVLALPDTRERHSERLSQAAASAGADFINRSDASATIRLIKSPALVFGDVCATATRDFCS